MNVPRATSARLYHAPVTIWLVRHAHAGSRTRWSGDDDARPLSDRGRAQAAAVATSLAEAPVGELLSSPSQRCVESLEPLGEALGLEVQLSSLLAEGGSGSKARALLLERAAALGPDHDLVACSHGDIIPAVLRRLERDGMRAPRPDVVQKGSIWELTVRGGKVVAGTYHGVPATDAD